MAGGIKNGVYITKKLMGALSLKDYQAVGFAGNWMQESHCDPGAVNKQEKAGTFKGSSANGAGYGAGLAQWSNAWKQKIQNYFNRHTPIETWTMDQQIDIVVKCCASSFINLLRNCSNAADSTDIVLRGYENGSGGYGTYLRPKHGKGSMDAYTWAKTVDVPGVGRRTFSGGYEGLITSRVAFAKQILQAMGSYSAAELASLGNIAGESGSGDYSGGGGNSGGGVPPTPEEIRRAIEQFRNAYPVHSEYLTYTGSGGNLFTNAKDNAFSTAALAEDTDNKTKEYFTNKITKHTRIYSTNDSCIVLDELRIRTNDAENSYENETWANKGITQADVDKLKEELKKQEEEAKKKAEEEKKKEEEAKKKEENKQEDTNKDENKK